LDTELGQHLRDALSDSYTLERELVGAGMSRVFVAEDRSLGRRVVIKVLPPEMAAAVRIERFRREIHLAASLTHPHIIPLLAAGEILGLPYYTMPFVEGESLKERLKRDSRLPIPEALRLASEVANALDYAHRSGIVHRDSLGFVQPIEPGAINWMTAGRGIAHSERTGDALRKTGSRLHGLQLWVALPKAHEETEPAFAHHPAATLPATDVDRVKLRVLAGSAYGLASPVQTLSELFYVEARMPRGTHLALPLETAERAAFVVSGEVECGGERIAAPRMIVFTRGAVAALSATADAHVMLLGGASLDGERHLWWNFVSSSKERIEQAKRDWAERRFASIPGETEFIPLPDY